MQPIRKFVWENIWFKDRHNNCRYASLLPRLRYVQPNYQLLSRYSIISGVQRRIYKYAWSLLGIEKLRLKYLSTKYKGFFCTDPGQIPILPGDIVVDVDDPILETSFVTMLNHKNVVAVVTTTDQLRSQMIDLGLKKPCHVIPSGVDLELIDNPFAKILEKTYPRQQNIVRLGYALPRFYIDSELSHLPPERKLHSISWLLEVFDDICQLNPSFELYLLGSASAGAKQLCQHNSRIKLLGYVPHEKICSYYSLFDIALYPRVTDVGGRHSIKLLEYMACGIPIVSTSVSESFRVAEAKAGLVCVDRNDFVLKTIKLASDPALCSEFGKNGRVYAGKFNWEYLAKEYDRLVFEPLLQRP